MTRYLVFTQRQPSFNDDVKQAHYVYLEDLRAQGKLEMWGPFSDKSGGAYVLIAANLEEATAMAHQDPVHLTGASKVIVYEWNAQ